MRALEIITGHVIYKPAYTYKFQLKTTFSKNIIHTAWTVKLILNSIKKLRLACLRPFSVTQYF